MSGGKVRVLEIVEDVPEINRGAMSNDEIRASKCQPILYIILVDSKH